MTPAMHGAARAERGGTLLEMMVATLCLGVIGAGVAGVSTSSSRALSTNATVLECQMRADRAVERLERHVRGASLSSLATLPAGFQTTQPLAEGVAADDLTWQAFAFDPAQVNDLPVVGGTAFTLALAPSATDPDNGLDDDRDGFVDERDLVLDRPDVAAEIVARDVVDCSFTLNGRMLLVSVQVRMRLRDGAPTLARATRSVEIRND